MLPRIPKRAVMEENEELNPRVSVMTKFLEKMGLKEEEQKE